MPERHEESMGKSATSDLHELDAIEARGKHGQVCETKFMTEYCTTKLRVYGWQNHREMIK